jgi:tyrosinase
MHVEIDIPGMDSQGRTFVTWTPVQATARLVDGVGSTSTIGVVFGNTGTVGRLSFASTRTSTFGSSVTRNLPLSGAPVPFWIAGRFGRPSSSYGDAAIRAVQKTVGTLLATKPLMVRIRKNAQTLGTVERDRFLNALGTLNGSGQGRFTDFRDMHVQISSGEAHGNVGFLPWHRAYVLDLERELQRIDPAVTLPYWRFDQPAPALFTTAFMGSSGANDIVQFTPGHPLEQWTTDSQVGITRGLRFATSGIPPSMISEAATLALGGTNQTYANFRSMEGTPHGRAHTGFRGSISSIPTAARDPLFFMLHANTDRLWAKWQWLNGRTDPADPNAYATPSPSRIGHALNDSMWPWNGVTTSPRPPTAPGGAFAGSPVTSLPGPSPTIRSVIDAQAVASSAPLGFAYDDVPFF